MTSNLRECPHCGQSEIFFEDRVHEDFDTFEDMEIFTLYETYKCHNCKKTFMVTSTYELTNVDIRETED